MTNTGNDLGNDKDPKKKRNIKHGLIAIVSLVVMTVAIILGIYFYQQFHAPEENIQPVRESHLSLNI